MLKATLFFVVALWAGLADAISTPYCSAALLNSCGGVRPGNVATVYNGLDATDCSIGGGTDVHMCFRQPGAWVVLAGGGGGSSAFNALTSGTNTTAVMTVGSGAQFLASGGIVEASKFKGAGSSTDAVDLATAEIAGVLADGNITSTVARVADLVPSSSIVRIDEDRTLASGTDLTIGTGANIAKTGVVSKCARFDATGNLVAATGDCTAGDTGGGGGAFGDQTDGTALNRTYTIGSGSFLVTAPGGILSANAAENNSVDLGTDTVGGYAGSATEGGSALTGDSATAFFTAGAIEAARGGTGIDSSAGTGIPHVATGSWTVSALVDADVPNTITIDSATSASDLSCTNCIGSTEITGLNLTSDVTGVLPIANGGTNAASFTASRCLRVDGTGAIVVATADCPDGDTGGGGGAPIGVDYLVGTANGTLTAEIVVGTTPGGELGNTWASPTLDDSVTVATWTLTGATIPDPTLDLADSAAPVPTTEGRAEWESDDDHLIVGDGASQAEFVPAEDVSGDLTMSDAGVTAIGTDKITEPMLKSVNGATDEYFLTYESTTGDFEWTDILGSSQVLRADANSTLASANVLTVANGAGVVFAGSTAPAPTTEGRFEWETDDDHLVVGDGTAAVEFVPAEDVSGDVTMTDAGVTAIGADKVTEAMLKSVDAAVDEECLTYESTVGDFEWQTCGGGGGAPTGVDYLVGTADATLTAEIVVGTTPGGELGNTWASPTLDDGVTVATWTLTSATIPDPTLDFLNSAAPVPTAEGRAEWEDDDDHLIVGDGTAAVEFVPAEDVSGDVTMTDAGVTAVGADKITEPMLKAVDAAVDEECLTYESTVGDFEWQTCGGGGGAPTTVDYLVGTADATLTAEIVVGTTPGGELGNTWASPTLDDGVTVATWTLTSATIPDPTLDILDGTAPTPTVEGRAEWENDDDHLIVGDGTAQVEFVPAEDVSGDITMTDAGVTAIGADKITEPMLKAVNTATDEYAVTYESTTGDFEYTQLLTASQVVRSDADTTLAANTDIIVPTGATISATGSGTITATNVVAETALLPFASYVFHLVSTATIETDDDKCGSTIFATTTMLACTTNTAAFKRGLIPISSTAYVKRLSCVVNSITGTADAGDTIDVDVVTINTTPTVTTVGSVLSLTATLAPGIAAETNPATTPSLAAGWIGVRVNASSADANNLITAWEVQCTLSMQL